MKNFFITITVATMAVLSDAGSPCPPREDIYPCICTNIALPKKQVFTDITCRHVSNTEALTSMFKDLKRIQIDRFIIYDSFWGVDDHQKKRLPDNWFSMLKIKDLQIIDSNLSHDIACTDFLVGCPNIVPTHLSVVNSSLTDHFVTYCKSKQSYSWINCMNKLQNFHFVYNRLTKIPKDFFMFKMEQLLVANFSNNAIAEIEDGAFKNLVKLTTLDLSHNRLRELKDIFGGEKTVLVHLDLSDNYIVKLPSDIFKLTPFLTYFGAANNQITKLPEADWKYLSKEIRTLELSGNSIQCDCHIIWINCTLKVHATVLGGCENEEYENTPLRRVSKFMSERCVDGVVQLREKDKKRNACDNWDKKENYVANPVRSGSRRHGNSAPFPPSVEEVIPGRKRRS